MATQGIPPGVRGCRVGYKDIHIPDRAGGGRTGSAGARPPGQPSPRRPSIRKKPRRRRAHPAPLSRELSPHPMITVTTEVVQTQQGTKDDPTRTPGCPVGSRAAHHHTAASHATSARATVQTAGQGTTQHGDHPADRIHRPGGGK